MVNDDLLMDVHDKVGIYFILMMAHGNVWYVQLQSMI